LEGEIFCLRLFLGDDGILGLQFLFVSCVDELDLLLVLQIGGLAVNSVLFFELLQGELGGRTALLEPLSLTLGLIEPSFQFSYFLVGVIEGDACLIELVLQLVLLLLE
jgi:hypothetical protein